MLDAETLAGILRDHRMVAEKGLRDAFERRQNVGNESLEECLMFLGLANYELLGRAYSLHYQLPYRPVFHPDLDQQLRERFSPRLVGKIKVLPVAFSDDQQLVLATCQP
ncbi:MAG: hypothetical protein JRJ56_04235, partial [Deltaproteobacteria bacterium]|nr:hypothetical protein [Deltaproteobacteria bacterium]